MAKAKRRHDAQNPDGGVPFGSFTFLVVSILIGGIAGLGAVVFRHLIALIHNLLFFGRASLAYDANLHTAASPLGPLVILVPVVGALGVVFLVKNFAPEAKGHGVPEVMDAIYYNRGVIRPVVAMIKALASALSIGSGGSVGREGPIIQIGSSIGSAAAQWLRMPVWQRITLIAAGTGSGIAATFNTPVGGVLFAIEIMMHEVSVRTLVPVTIATATATYVGRTVFGPNPSFVIPGFEAPYFHLTRPGVLVLYVGLGVLMGVASALFIKSIYGCEDLFDRWVPGGYWVRHPLGMLLVGVMLWATIERTGHYYIGGVGYATVQDILSGVKLPIALLLALFALKLLATSLTLGSGASGGIFSPALFLGATLGGAYGGALAHVFPGIGISPPAFAVAGMAAVVAGSTGAALAAIVMIFEMTRDYNVIIPITIAVALSYEVRKKLSWESIYTQKLVRRGHYMPEALQTNMAFVMRATGMMATPIHIVSASDTLGDFVSHWLEEPKVGGFLVSDGDSVVGYLTKRVALNVLAHSGSGIALGEAAQNDYIVVPENATLFEIITAMRHRGATVALVSTDPDILDGAAVRGLITKEQIADAMAEVMELYPG